MLGLALNLKTMSIAGVIALVMGAGAGWKARDAFCDAAHFKAQTELLRAEKRNLENLVARMRLVAEADAQKHIEHAEEIARLEKQINETTLEAGQCFSADDADRVRDLWK